MLTTMSSADNELQFAFHLADLAAEIGQAHQSALGDVTKADGSLQTAADRLISQRMNDEIKAAYPQDGIVDEEADPHAEQAERVWVLDPIDGTAQFARGNDVWGTLISLRQGSKALMSLVSAPDLALRFFACGSGPAIKMDCLNGEQQEMTVSSVKHLSEAAITVGAADLAFSHKFDKRLLRLAQQCKSYFGAESFLPYLLVAEGKADLCAIPNAHRWDWSATGHIVEAAGGHYHLASFAEGCQTVICSNQVLEAEIADSLNHRSYSARL